MAKKEKFSRKEAIEYLADSGFKFKKGHKYTDKYLKRTAASYKKQKAEGHSPSLSRARGHGKVEHIPRSGRIREQYKIGSKERKATKKDIEQLRKEAAKGTRLKKNETPEQYTQRTGKAYKSAITTHETTTDRGEKLQYVTGNVTGITCADSPFTSDLGPEQEGTLSFHVPASHFDAIMASSKDVTELANNLMQSSGISIQWCEIYSINIT